MISTIKCIKNLLRYYLFNSIKLYQNDIVTILFDLTLRYEFYADT